MIWTMILIITWNNGTTSQAIQFKSKTLCETAKSAVMAGLKDKFGWTSDVVAVCVESKEE